MEAGVHPGGVHAVDVNRAGRADVGADVARRPTAFHSAELGAVLDEDLCGPGVSDVERVPVPTSNEPSPLRKTLAVPPASAKRVLPINASPPEKTTSDPCERAADRARVERLKSRSLDHADRARAVDEQV